MRPAVAKSRCEPDLVRANPPHPAKVPSRNREARCLDWATSIQRGRRNRRASVAFAVEKHPTDASPMGQIMAQAVQAYRRLSLRASSALIFAGTLAFAPA